MSKTLLVSDLHLEFQADHGKRLISDLADADTLVIAGDMTPLPGLEAAFEKVCKKFQDVIFVSGNHELWGGYDREDLITAMAGFQKKYSNLHWLNKSSVNIGGQRFIGATLWFDDTPAARMNMKWKDFTYIKDFPKWVYDENALTKKYLEDNVVADDIVVTHYLPSYQSVSEKYKDNLMTCFFVSNMEKMIAKAQPKKWLHGHTHTSFNYKIGNTEIHCNPFGYVKYDPNPQFNYSFFV